MPPSFYCGGLHQPHQQQPTVQLSEPADEPVERECEDLAQWTRLQAFLASARGLKRPERATAVHDGHRPRGLHQQPHQPSAPLDERDLDLDLDVQPHSTQLPAVRESRYMGVSWHKKSGGWMAQIRHERGTEFLGLFAESEEEKAARAYDAAARRLLSSSASGGSWLSSWPPCVLNFPST